MPSLSDEVPSGSTVQPPLPNPDAGPGLIWPTPHGRAVLRRVAVAGTPLRHETSEEGAHVFEAGIWRLQTCDADHLDSLQAARSRLVARVRTLCRLGPLAPRDLTLTVASTRAEGAWIWRVSPWLASLREAIQFAEQHADAPTLAEAYRGYALCLTDAIALWLEEGIGIQLDLDSFGVVGKRRCYLGVRVEEDGNCDGLADALAQPLSGAHRPSPALITTYFTTFEKAVLERFDGPQIARTGLLPAVRSLAARDATAVRGRDRLANRLQQRADAPPGALP